MRNFNYFSFYVYSPAPQELNYKNLYMNTFEDQYIYYRTTSNQENISGILSKYTIRSYYRQYISFEQSCLYVPCPFIILCVMFLYSCNIYGIWSRKQRTYNTTKSLRRTSAYGPSSKCRYSPTYKRTASYKRTETGHTKRQSQQSTTRH